MRILFDISMCYNGGYRERVRGNVKHSYRYLGQPVRRLPLDCIGPDEIEGPDETVFGRASVSFL